MKLSIDQNIPLPKEWLPAQGVEIETFDGRQLTSAGLQHTDLLFVRSVTQVNRELLQGSAVRFVGSATAGFDHMNGSQLEELGIAWSCAPGCNADAVVDYVLASLARLFIDPRKRRVGIVGCGQVGGRLYRRLRQLGVEALCYDPFLQNSQQPGLVELDELLSSCDLVSLHTPLTSAGAHSTFHMLDARRLGLLKPDSLLINAGRGGVIDEQALLQRLRRDQDLRLVLDVWEGEPHISAELQQYASLATPHIAGYSSRGKLRGSWMLIHELNRQLELNWPVPTELPKVFTDMQLAAGLDWRSAILDLYDPAEDDMRLRDAYEVEKGAGFDRLRRQYPQRAELSECRVNEPELECWGFSRG